jgi:hypothetical protein
MLEHLLIFIFLKPLKLVLDLYKLMNQDILNLIAVMGR